MTEIKHPNLSNEQLIELLQCIRVINFKNYPDHFKGLDAPYGHDLIDTVVQRLRAGNTNTPTSQLNVRLNPLFQANHDLKGYIYNTAMLLHSPPQAAELAEDIVRAIEKGQLVMQESLAEIILEIVRGDTRLSPVPEGCAAFGTSDGLWQIVVIPNDAV